MSRTGEYLSREDIQVKPIGASFGFYDADDLRRVSVLAITNASSRDALDNPTANGIYDPRLGPVDSSQPCGTCQLSEHQCPGHIGHIELAVPLYNPLSFRHLMYLLQVKCFVCNKFRAHSSEIHKYTKILDFLEKGDLDGALNAQHTLESYQEEDATTLFNERRSLPPNVPGAGSLQLSTGVEKKARVGNSDCNAINDYRNQVLSLLRKDLRKSVCKNCGAASPALVRGPDNTKIFIKPLSSKALDRNNQLRIPWSHTYQAVPFQAPSKAKDNKADPTPIDDDNDDNDDDDDDDSSSSSSSSNRNSDTDSSASDDDESATDTSSDTKAAKQRKTKNGSVTANQAKKPENTDARLFLAPTEALKHVALTWQEHAALLNHMFVGRRRANKPHPYRSIFFVDCVAVPATRFRLTPSGGELSRHPQDQFFEQLLSANEQFVHDLQATGDESQENQHRKRVDLWTRMQASLAGLYDTEVNPMKPGMLGIKQLLEKKEGLFRMNMMGKRVNYAARSVISPDVNLATNEIGIPQEFARTLVVKEQVCGYNHDALVRAVLNGAHQWPGANVVCIGDRQRLDLSAKKYADRVARRAVAMRLVSREQAVVVHRHVRDGDHVLMNRQPTLHKPSIMAHRVRVLGTDRVLRMHYANCNVYNADFDGDEMNMHLPQDLLATAEAAQLAAADQQYCVPRDGAPARGLIQDHVAAGVLLTKKDCFLTLAEFQQLLWAAGAALDNDVALREERAALGDVTAVRSVHRVRIPQPCILRPRRLWTGKQLLRAMLDLCAPGRAPMTMESRSRVKKEAWRGHEEEGTVLVRGGDLLTGILDKSQFGASSFGVVHCAYELYGGAVAGRLLSSLGRLFSAYLRGHGFTCGIDDLLLTPPAEAARRATIATARGAAMDAAAEFVGLSGSSLGNNSDSDNEEEEDDDAVQATSVASRHDVDDPAYAALISRQLRRALRNDPAAGKALDSCFTGTLAGCTSRTIAACFPAGLVVQFPRNMMSLMTTSGAKGSQVNAAQISCLLGSQELEGRRVPLMASGKSLPCFEPHSPLPRAGGYVSDRYLTGIRPQEYFFHCMAGREGLVDTAIKTARSGYLQRCLIKQLENMVVAYDGTVRDLNDQTILQFGYGDDELDVASGAALFLGTDTPRFKFYAENYSACKSRYDVSGVRVRHRAPIDVDCSSVPDDDLQTRPAAASHYASVSEGFRKKLGLFIEESRGSLLSSSSGVNDDSMAVDVKVEHKKSKKRSKKSKAKPVVAAVQSSSGSAPSAEQFRELMYVKYQASTAQPGEAVGLLAAQSIGEPSTQMTLNTFHLAGRGDLNVTLGIPRLVEILMSGARRLNTPSMRVVLQPPANKAAAQRVQHALSRFVLGDAIAALSCEQRLVNTPGGFQRRYRLVVKLHDKEVLEGRTDIKAILWALAKRPSHNFLRRLLEDVHKEVRRGKVTVSKTGKRDAAADAAADATEDPGEMESSSSRSRKRARNSDADSTKESTTEMTEPADDQAEEGELTSESDSNSSDSQGSYESSGDDSSSNSGSSSGGASSSSDMNPADATTERSDGDPIQQPATIDIDHFVPDKHRGYLHSYEYNRNTRTATIVLTTSLASRKLLCVGLAETAAQSTIVRHVPGVSRGVLVEARPPPGYEVHTDGINLRGALTLPESLIDVNQLTCNDIHAMIDVYGIEAGRNLLVHEIVSVFGAYGISVDRRHIALVADFLTNSGRYRAFNRRTLASSPSPLLQMSYETTVGFLGEAVSRGKVDALDSASARIVVGRPVGVGSGVCDVLTKLN